MILFCYYIKAKKIPKHIHKTATVPFEKSKIFCFSSIMKKIFAGSSQSPFLSKLICGATFGLVSSAC